MSKAERINLSELYYSKLTQDKLVDWKNLPKYQDGHPDVNYIEATVGDLTRFLATEASPYSDESSRRYQPESINVGQILFAMADKNLGITTRHEEPIAIVAGGNRNQYIYETDDPNIFFILAVVDPLERADRGDSIKTTSLGSLEKYTPDQREIMLTYINSDRMRPSRLDL
jgi:hypothetical protein